MEYLIFDPNSSLSRIRGVVVSKSLLQGTNKYRVFRTYFSGSCMHALSTVIRSQALLSTDLYAIR